MHGTNQDHLIKTNSKASCVHKKLNVTIKYHVHETNKDHLIKINSKLNITN